MSAYATYTAGTTTAGNKSHAEGLKENAERDTAWTLYHKINEDLKNGLSSELKIRSDSRVCAFTRPNSTSPYMKGKLTDEELIVVDKIAPSENSHSYFARISECTSSNLSNRQCKEFVGCWVSLSSSNLKYGGTTMYF